MEKLKLKLNKKQLVLALFIAGAVLILFDIIMMAVVVPQGRPGFFKIMLALIFGLMTLLGVWLLLARLMRRITRSPVSSLVGIFRRVSSS